MQEKLTSSSNAKIKHPATPEEQQTHVKKWKRSGLSMNEYIADKIILQYQIQ